MSATPITKDQAYHLLDLARAVVVDDLGVCFHVLHEDTGEMDCWLDVNFTDSDGYEHEFIVETTEGITWDGAQLSIPYEGQELLLQPLVDAGPKLLNFQEFEMRLLSPATVSDSKKVSGKVVLDSVKDSLPLWSINDGGSTPEGVTAKKVQHTTFHYYKYTFPELAPALRTYSVSGRDTPLVFEFKGRRWKAQLDASYDHGHPSKVVATFEETDDELPVNMHSMKGRTGVSHMFGQPSFIQGEVLPHYNGRAAYPLATIESGWGDDGNENVFVAFNDDGIPCGLYHEFSCH